MSAIPSPSQSVATGSGNAAPPVSPVEIDASCRFPLLLLFVSAAVWLLIGSVLAMIATLKFHAPNLLADHACLTYGRVHPAHLNAFIYGFAIQAGLGVLLWLTCHLGRVRLALSPIIVAGTLFWNLGVLLGVWGILYGESTGFEWLEMPRYASVMLFISYLAIGLGAMATFHLRREGQLYTSQWFLIAALFWFPWIYSTANLLLVAMPVRGALQAVINWWYAHNLMNVWFGFVGLAAIFYFIPKITKRPLYSHYIGIFIFWTLIIFGSWGGIPTGSPLPAWMPALSTMAAVLTIIPVLAVAINVRRTMAGQWAALKLSTPLRFIRFGAAAFVLAGLAGAVASLNQVSEVVNFTWFIPAQTQLFIYGFFAMTMFGAIYYIVPRLTGIEFCKPGMVTVHFHFARLGILVYALALGFGGVREGIMLNTKDGAFLDAVGSILPYLRISTTGDLLMAIGNLIFLLNLVGLLFRLGRTSASSFLATNTKTAEVAS